MISAATQPDSRQRQFEWAHREDDVQELALTARRHPDVDMPAALQQISGWQTARTKLPLWAATPGVRYPVHLSMEQCSSQLAAAYKASLVGSGERMADLTGGFGVDAAMLGRKFNHLLFVERDEVLCRLAANNLPLLGISHHEVQRADAADVLAGLPRQQLIFLDPARRNRQGGKVVAIGDCTPNVALLQDLLLQKADTVLVKLSPMLDLKAVERELRNVCEVHIVSIHGECKEVLVKMEAGSDPARPIRYVCVNLPQEGSITFTAESERQAPCPYAATLGRYLYEPNASIMKAGCFRTVAQAYQLQKLSPNSHLYTSHELRNGFPGRTFLVEATSSLNRHETKALLADIRQANISVRNFPLTADELRRRLKLRDGGDRYLFATTLTDGSHRLIRLCHIADTIANVVSPG